MRVCHLCGATVHVFGACAILWGCQFLWKVVFTVKNRSSLLTFVVLNVIISMAVAFGLITFLGGGSGSGQSQIVPVTMQIIITSTPNEAGDATRIAQAVESTVSALEEQLSGASVELPTDIAALLSAPSGGSGTPSAALSANAASVPTSARPDLPNGCVPHVLATNENPSTLSEEYGVSIFAILAANGLTEDDARFLQIGQELIIPLEGCPVTELQPTATPTPEVTETPEASATDGDDSTSVATTTGGTPNATPTQTPTATATLALAPTALNAQVSITEILAPGDITAEGITILNRGSAVNIGGWKLVNSQGVEFVFPEQRLFTNGSVTIYTRAGENTPVVFFWGRSAAVWGATDETATLLDSNDRVQSAVRVQDARR